MANTKGRVPGQYPAQPRQQAVRTVHGAPPEEQQSPGVAADRGGAGRRTLEIHFKLFGTDGVSLQSQELSKALSVRGWRVMFCACDVPAGAEGLRLPRDSLTSRRMQSRCVRRIFSPAPGASLPVSDGAALVDEITGRARVIRRQVEDYVDAQQIPLLHIRNVMSLPYNLPATLALYNLAVERPDIGFLMSSTTTCTGKVPTPRTSCHRTGTSAT